MVLFLDWLNDCISLSNDFLWGYLLIVLLVFVGVLFSVKTRFVQFRFFREMFRLLSEGIAGADKKNVTSFQAFCVATASRVGTGNMAGVATALVLGGPGAIFWMWLMALLGAASAFVESTLAQIYKVPAVGSFMGGPAFYIRRALKSKVLAGLFAVIICITFGLAFNSVQSNTIAIAFRDAFGVKESWMGVMVTVGTVFVIFGGVHRVAVVSQMVVPVMAFFYILIALFVIITHFSMLPQLFSSIIESAFGWQQFAGGALGATIMQGVRRGSFSNEAGMGSAPNAAATATVSHPAKQGLIQSLSVFTDTLLICSCTAFIVLLSGEPLDGSSKGIALTHNALVAELGPSGGFFLAIAILLFSFSSIVGNYSYCETNILFMTRKKSILYTYRLLVGVGVFVGSVASLDLVWNIADFMMALMAIINLYAIFRLRKIAFSALNDYALKRKNGEKIVSFKGSDIGLHDTDCWN